MFELSENICSSLSYQKPPDSQNWSERQQVSRSSERPRGTQNFSELILGRSQLKFSAYKKSKPAPSKPKYGLNNYLVPKSPYKPKEIYKYLWLLDSDLKVEKGCLSTLVRLMESDVNIGISSPKILNLHNNDLIVTLGAKLELQKGNKYDLFANQPDINSDKIFHVDPGS